MLLNGYRMRCTELPLPYNGLGQQMSGQVMNIYLEPGLLTHITLGSGLELCQLNVIWTAKTSGLLGS
jgi:hypothetical protein